MSPLECTCAWATLGLPGVALGSPMLRFLCPLMLLSHTLYLCRFALALHTPCWPATWHLGPGNSWTLQLDGRQRSRRADYRTTYIAAAHSWRRSSSVRLKPFLAARKTSKPEGPAQTLASSAAAATSARNAQQQFNYVTRHGPGWRGQYRFQGKKLEAGTYTSEKEAALAVTRYERSAL